MTKVPVENYLLSIYRSFWANIEDTWGPNHPDWYRVHGRDGYRIFSASISLASIPTFANKSSVESCIVLINNVYIIA